MKEPTNKTKREEASVVKQMESYTDEELHSWLDSTWFKLFKKMANRMLSRPLAVLTVLKSAQEKIRSYDSISHFSSEAFQGLSTVIRLVRASMNGSYTSLSKVNLGLCVAAILYFINPIDVIPDFLSIGLLDDLAILTWVIHTIQSEYDSFLAWEDDQKIKIDI